LQTLTKGKCKDTVSLRLEPNLKAATEFTQNAPSKIENPPPDEDLFGELGERKRKNRKISGFSIFNKNPLLGKEEVKRIGDDQDTNSLLIDFEFEIIGDKDSVESIA
jgi:hypothetical protein